MSRELSTPLEYRNFITTLMAANTTVARLLVPPQYPRVKTAIPLEVNPPNVPTTPLIQHVFYGGGRVSDVVVSCTDVTDKSVVLYELDPVFIVSAAAVPYSFGSVTGAVVTTATTTITRASGSFNGASVTTGDGVRAGDVLMCFAPIGSPANGSDGILLPISAAGALTLTTAGLTNETLIDQTVFYRVGQKCVTLVPTGANSTGSGNSNGVANVSLINNGNDSSKEYGFEIGPNGALAVAMVSAAAANKIFFFKAGVSLR